MVGVLEMKKLTSIPSILFSKEQTIALKLKEQPYIILIPKSIIQKLGITEENLDFKLVINENKITLLGPELPNPRVKPPAKEIILE